MGNILEVFNKMFPEGALEKMSFQELSDLRKSIHEQEDQMINNISSHSPVITRGCLLDFADVNMSILAQMITMKGKEIKNQMDEKNIPKRKCALNPITILGKVECLFFLSKFDMFRDRKGGDVLRTCTIYSIPSLLFANDFIERKVTDSAQVLSEGKVQRVIDSYPLCTPVELDLQGCLKAAEEGYDWPINAGLVHVVES
jgi:hypothetical protein